MLAYGVCDKLNQNPQHVMRVCDLGQGSRQREGSRMEHVAEQYADASVRTHNAGQGKVTTSYIGGGGP